MELQEREDEKDKKHTGKLIREPEDNGCLLTLKFRKRRLFANQKF